MDILYYSNYCKHSQKIIQILVKNDIINEISCICIDKRSLNPQNGQTYISLENGSKVILPPNVKTVPSLLLIKQQYKVIVGDDIVAHFHPQMKTNNNVATMNNGEPLGYHLAISNGGTNIMSEQYTDYNMTPDELSSNGNGGRRPMHNYVPFSDKINVINTPPDTYRPDKVSNDVTIDTLQQKRFDDIDSSK
jgi:hypothetical protein